MRTERLNPLNDYLFLKIMGEKGDEEQLAAFLNAVLCRRGKSPIASVEIIENRALTADVIGDKASILDIRAVLADSTRVNIEVQLRNLRNMDRRSLFYWSREYTRSLEAGQDYHELPNVIAINIVNFEFLPGGDFHTTFHLWEDRQKELMLTDALEIHFLDMVKFRELVEKDIRNDPLHRWLAWLDQDSPPELVEEAVKMDRAIQKAEAKVKHVSHDKESLRAYEMRQMALSDFNTAVNSARREGVREGLREGEKEGMRKGIREGLREGEGKKAAEIARNLKAVGAPVGQIAQVTGLSEAQIRNL